MPETLFVKFRAYFSLEDSSGRSSSIDNDQHCQQNINYNSFGQLGNINPYYELFDQPKFKSSPCRYNRYFKNHLVLLAVTMTKYWLQGILSNAFKIHVFCNLKP